jgi:hypothetical protein
MYDIISEPVICPICGLSSDSEVQTVIREKPDGSYLHIGDPLIVTKQLAEDADYGILKLPEAGEMIYVLDVWDCPNGHIYNWVKTAVKDGVIKEVSAVLKNRQTLEKAHFIDVECICGLASDAGYVQKDPKTGYVVITGLDLEENLLNTLISLIEIIENDKKARLENQK